MKEIKEINDFLLGMFTCADELRPAMAVPNLKDGIVYATDGHALISIPENELSLSYPTSEKYPAADTLLNGHIAKCTKKTVIKLSDIAKELAKARIVVDKNFINCEECNGSGTVEWEYESKSGREYTKEEDCPVCEGKCKDEISHPFARVRFYASEENGDKGEYGIHVGDLYFAPFHLYRLFMVAFYHRADVIEIFSDPDSYGVAIASFGNIKVLIMMKYKP